MLHMYVRYTYISLPQIMYLRIRVSAYTYVPSLTLIMCGIKRYSVGMSKRVLRVELSKSEWQFFDSYCRSLPQYQLTRNLK